MAAVTKNRAAGLCFLHRLWPVVQRLAMASVFSLLLFPVHHYSCKNDEYSTGDLMLLLTN